MAFAGEQNKQLGELGAEAAVVGSQVIGYAQKVVGAASALTTGGTSSVLATTTVSAGGTILGVSALAFGVIGLALAVVSVVYNLVMGNQAKAKMHRKLREAKREMIRDIGVELVDQVYGMAIPGWSFWAVPEGRGESIKSLSGEYFIFGSMYYGWSQINIEDPNYEPKRRTIALWLRDRGLDPTRFIGGTNVREDEQLIPIEMFVALPERIIISKEALNFLGYESSVVDSLDTDFLIRLFDMIQSMGKVKTENQAVLVKKDIEDWLISRSLDPKIFFQKAAISVPSPVNTSMALAPEPLLLPGEAAERVSISESKISPLLLIGLILGGFLFLFSKEKEF